MANNTVVLNVETKELDAALEKAKELEETLKRVHTLIDSLISK